MLISDKIKIASAGKVKCQPDWIWDNKGHPDQDFDLWTILDGQGRLESGSKVHELSAGDSFLLRGKDSYLGSTSKLHPLKVIFIHFDFCDAKGKLIRPEESQLPALYRKVNNFPFFLKMLNRTLFYYQANSPNANHWLHTALLELVHQEEQETAEQDQDEVTKFINQLCREIQNNPAQEYFLPEIAAEVSYSSDHFSKLFKQQQQITFRDFVINSRIDMAKIHLRSSSMQVAEIAEIMGYRDIYLFSKQFKQKTRMTPTEYRKG